MTEDAGVYDKDLLGIPDQSGISARTETASTENALKAASDLGCLENTADGSYGPKTADAVSAAQQAFGMEADGIASALFQARLYDDQ